MRNLCKVTLTLAVAALMATPALAQRQRPGGGRGGFGFGRSLLTNKSVQEELKLSSDQKTKVEALAKKNQEMVREKMKDVPRDQIREKMPAIMMEVRAQTDKALPGVLKPDQLKRYKQIEIQQMGLRAFTNKDVQSALKLNDAQKTSIKEIAEGVQKKVAEETKDLTGRERFTKGQEIRTKLNKEAKDKIATTLSSDQKKTWKELVGAPFEIKREGRPGGGRRPGAPRRDI